VFPDDFVSFKSFAELLISPRFFPCFFGAKLTPFWSKLEQKCSKNKKSMIFWSQTGVRVESPGITPRKVQERVVTKWRQVVTSGDKKIKSKKKKVKVQEKSGDKSDSESESTPAWSPEKNIFIK
jgi:hypothetical protein